MKRTIFITCVCLMACLTSSRAQDASVYFIIDYMKSAPGMADDYVEAERNTWKALHQIRKEKGQINDWWLFSVVSPSGTDVEYDFVTVTQVVGWDNLEKARTGWNEVVDRFSDKKLEEIYAVTELRNLIRTEVLSNVTYAQKEGFEGDPRYVVVNYMDTEPGQLQAYFDLEVDIVKPIFEAEMKAGNGRAVWAVYNRVFPIGESYGYDAVTADFYETWSDMQGSGNFVQMFEKVHPDMSIEDFGNKIESTRTLVKADVLEFIDSL